MTNEEAISVIENDIQIDVRLCTDEQVDRFQTALYMAISALRAEPTGKALTIEQLRKMDGQPVWIQNIEEPDKSQWRLCHWDRGKYLVLQGISVKGYLLEEYGESWLAYAYPPAHIDMEAWEKPCGMCGGKTTLYQHTNTTKLFMNTFWEAATLVTECMACPPYADCCMKGISANSAFKIKFCPECGRPLTEEAWAELEKRMGVQKVPLWNHCAICGKRIEAGEPCIGIEKKNTEIVGDSICFDCVNIENMHGLDKTVAITDLLARAEVAEARCKLAEKCFDDSALHACETQLELEKKARAEADARAEKAERERDAAISDLTYIARTYPVDLCDDLVCQYCKHYQNVNTGCPGWTENDCFEWRGKKEE